MIGTDYGDAWVCTDCYFAHHYGAHEHEGEWFAGDSDSPCDEEPLSELEGLEVADNTCSDHDNREHECPVCDDGVVAWLPFPGTLPLYEEWPFGYPVLCWVCDGDGKILVPCPYCHSDDDENGIQEFSWSSCEGCGSHLGGSRYRLHLWKREEANA
jgi:hypothetical protein